MKIDPNISIYIQLADFIKYDIFSKKIKPGEKIESIREMALKLEVNPNTIKRVYQELEVEGLIFSNGTLGTFIVEDEKLIEKKRDIFIANKLNEFLNVLKKCNVESDELLKYVKDGIYNGNN